MKETKIKERFENAFDAFFDNEKLSENSALSSVNNSTIYQTKETLSFKEKYKTLINIMKQSLLFFPGTFILFFISFAFSVVSINNPFNVWIPEGRLFWVIFWFWLGVIMTWAGLGDTRNPKHFVIPASIITTGFIVGAISGINSILFNQIEDLVFSDAYPLYFFPFALMIPFLAKGLVDRKNEDA